MRSVQLLQVTDPHLYGDPSRKLYGVNTAESLRRVLETALAAGPVPDAVLVTGDIGDDLSEAAYAQFRAALTGCGAPVFCLPGNHDAPALMARLLDADGFQYCGRTRLGAWGLLMLDTHLPGSAAGRVADAELERLDAELGAMAGLPVLVALHHPPLPVGSPWLDAVGLDNAAQLLEVLDRHPQARAVVAGHVHQEFAARRGAVDYYTTPSTCAQFTPRTPRCVMDRRPPGYRWLTLHPDGSHATQVGWLPALIGTPRQEDEARR
jgi:Icc protein